MYIFSVDLGEQCLTDQLSEKGLGLEIKSLALVLVLKIMEVWVLVMRSRALVLVLTTKSYLHHCNSLVKSCKFYQPTQNLSPCC